MSSIYKVELTKDAYKFLRKQDKKRRVQIANVIDLLRKDPFPAKNIKPLKGWSKAVYRIRIGDFRLLYQVKKRELIIVVIKIGPRGDVYK